MTDLTDLADIVLQIHEMTEEEAIAFGVPLEDRWRYFRVDTIKGPQQEAPNERRP